MIEATPHETIQGVRFDHWYGGNGDPPNGPTSEAKGGSTTRPLAVSGPIIRASGMNRGERPKPKLRSSQRLACFDRQKLNHLPRFSHLPSSAPRRCSEITD